MKRYIEALCLLTVSLILNTSCLGSNDDSNTEYSNDTAIKTFSLTTVNRYVHTTSKSGKDSVYKKSLSNPVVFTIDQYQRKIYNTDSLPADCDLKHVLASISSVNNGTIVINYADKSSNDSLMYFSSTDSIDFTKVKDVRVYAYDGSGFRTYQLSINIHQIESNRMIWEQMSAADVPVDKDKAIWEQRVAAAGLQKFIGAYHDEGYAYDANGTLMVSNDMGLTWQEDYVNDDTSLLPRDNFAFAAWPFAPNDSTDYQLMIGTSPLYDKACVVWRKISEHAYRSLISKWVYLPLESFNDYYLPKMENLNLVYYNQLPLAIGNDGKIYVSRDQGITWKTTSAYTLPDKIGTYNLTAIADDDYLWLVGKDTGEVWRGKIIE